VHSEADPVSLYSHEILSSHVLYQKIQKSDILTWQEVLGVSRDATKVEIKKAYHKVRLYDTQVLHPE
jgi:preprotein translocase subunit Sec63